MEHTVEASCQHREIGCEIEKILQVSSVPTEFFEEIDWATSSYSTA